MSSEVEPTQEALRTEFPFVFHAALKINWNIAKESEKRIYFPPTFEKDGSFVHRTADPDRLLSVLNHFYTESEGDWTCLKMSCDSLEKNGVKTIFEAPAPVGDTKPPKGQNGEKLYFPHIMGGIPVDSVLEELSIIRDKATGKFLNVPGVTS